MNNKLHMNKKTIFTVALVIILILIAVLIAFYVVSAIQKSEIKKAINAAWSFNDKDKAKYLTELDALSTYEVISIEKKGEEYIVKTAVTAPDLGERLSAIDYLDFPRDKEEDAINAFLSKQIKEAKIKKTNAEIYAYKINGKYEITFSDTFVDAMSGNVYKYSLKAFEDIAKMKSKEDDK